MTEAQRDRIERSRRLVDTWLDATLSGDARRIPTAMAPLNAFIRTAPTDLASNVRLVGLIMALGDQRAVTDHESAMLAMT
jgi:hypothetical protein